MPCEKKADFIEIRTLKCQQDVKQISNKTKSWRDGRTEKRNWTHGEAQVLIELLESLLAYQIFTRMIIQRRSRKRKPAQN